MRKRILSCLLCVILLISTFSVSVQAEESTYYQIMIDSGDGVHSEKAIIEGNEIYIAATSFSKYTRFEFDEATQTFLVKGQKADKAFKKVIVNAKMKKAAVGTKLIELENSFVVDGVAYLPFCQMLPILNASIFEVDSGVIHVVNTELSMAELLYDFDINDYSFNISEEFFGRTDFLYWYIAPSYLFDTVVNFRFDRLDIVFESGSCEDYQTILTNYLKDDELFNKAMSEDDFAGELLESITGLTGVTGKLNDVYDWFEKIEKIDYDPLLSDKLVEFIQKTNSSEVFDDQLHTWIEVIHGDIVEIGEKEFSAADILEGIDFLYTYLNQVEDHQCMLDAVYGIAERQNKLESIPGASSLFTSVDPEYLAAERIYELYTGNIIPAVTKKTVEKTAEELLEDFVAVKTLGIYSLTAGLAGEILELYLPGDSGDRALLPQHSNIANSAMRKAAVPTLDTEESTDEYRLSLLLTLLSSRACYDIMADTAAGYGQDNAYYKSRIENIETMIMGLYLLAGNVAFDTYENFEKFAEQNRETIIASELLKTTQEYTSIFEKLFDETCWVWNKGVTSGTAYAVLFHLDGKLSYYKMNEDLLGSTTYEYENETLTIDGVDYFWQDDKFVSIEKFEVNGSGELEEFKLYLDDQERFYQFVPSFSVEHFVDEIQVDFGIASYAEFISCIGARFQEYPADIDGFITAVSIDLNADGKDEQLVLISRNQVIYLQVYSESNGKYVLSCENYITSLDYCSQQNISMFYNNELGGYLLFVDRNTVGAYTGFDGYFASLYFVMPSYIELYSSINEMDFNTEKEDIPAILQQWGVPYAQNCAVINNITSQSQYTELLEVKHRYYNADPMGGWNGREHYLQFRTPEKRSEPVDAI